MAHDLAASRRVRKGVLPAPSGLDERLVPDAPPDGAGPTPPVLGERVVADVRHEIGNYFHKLYYWADFLTESRSGRAGDVTATQMLEETIRGLEALVRTTLECVRPMAATPIHMALGEVADGVVRQLRAGLEGREVAVSSDTIVPSGRSVLLDVGRLSQLLSLLACRVVAATDPAQGLDLRIDLAGREGGEALVVELVGDGTGVAHSTLADLEWANAENVARLVGGELVWHDANGRVTVSLTLLLRS